MLAVGTILYGFCGGAFGRDSYDDKRVEAVGVDWVVVRNEAGYAGFACGDDIHEDLAKFTERPKEDQ